MKRINVVGTSASGKSTFAKQLAQQLNVDYIELDDLYWLDDWQEPTDALFFEKIQNAIDQAEHGFVLDGNYSRTNNIKWQQVDTIIWLDLPFQINMYRSIKRALHRAFTKRQLWSNSNNTESFRKMLSTDSVIWWMMKTHKKNQKKYLKWMQSNQYPNIDWIHLSSIAEVKAFLTEHQSPK